MSGLVQAQWSLNTTSEQAISIARGVLIAATSDNVQPLAIIACEGFGNTIAMSREACERVEKRVLPTPQPSVIHFLQTLVGYSRSDCATQLGQTQAGVQFLGLASALVSTMGLFRSAEGVWLMLETSARDKRLLPTSRQIKDLLASLESRCHFSGFMDSVLSWQSKLRDWEFGQREIPEIMERSSWYPTSDGLEKLVDAFRQLRRIGDTSVTRVSIRTTSCTPWVAAFTEWCLGQRPSIFMDDGRQIISEPNSAVVITTTTGMTEDEPPGFEVNVHYDMKGPKQLVNSGIQGPWEGLSEIDKYGKWLFQNYELDVELAGKAAKEILPSAIHQVLICLHFSRYKQFDHKVSLDQWPFVEAQPERPQIDESMQNLRVYPFPGFAAVTQMLKILTGGQLERLYPLDRGILVKDLPTAQLHLREMARLCGCPECATLGPRTVGSPGGNIFKRCDRKQFFHKLSIIIADTLALSLFHCPDDLRIRIPISCHRDSRNQFKCAVESIITTGEIKYCEFTSLLDWALALVGHDVSQDVKSHNWVMSCDSGQAVWPTIYDTSIIDKHGFMSLSWLRGDLRYKEEQYKLVRSSDEGTLMMNPMDDIREGSVKELCNLFPDLKLAWRLKVGDRILNASLGLAGMEGRYDFVRVSPALLIANLATALIVEECHHEANSALETVDRFSSYTGVLNPTQPAAMTRDKNFMKVGVVAVDGADDLRLFALSCGDTIAPIVVRKDACLSCCLDICRKTSFPVLIL
jgi:hypothetical protein